MLSKIHIFSGAVEIDLLAKMFLVEGKRIEIEENDEYATKVENGEHLILWNSNLLYDLWADKYDVRMLLNDYHEFEFVDVQEKNFIENYYKSETEEEEIMSERYQDLTNFTEDDLLPINPQTNQQTALQKEEKPYQLPAYVSLPSNIDIPRTQKSFNVIAHTTKSTRMNPQLEILLRVKQSANPAFSFLFPGNLLYPFYQVTIMIFSLSHL
jgi:hypothetical protein